MKPSFVDTINGYRSAYYRDHNQQDSHTPVYSIYIDGDLLSANNVCKCAAFERVIDRHQLFQSPESGVGIEWAAGIEIT